MRLPLSVDLSPRESPSEKNLRLWTLTLSLSWFFSIFKPSRIESLVLSLTRLFPFFCFLQSIHHHARARRRMYHGYYRPLSPSLSPLSLSRYNVAVVYSNANPSSELTRFLCFLRFLQSIDSHARARRRGAYGYERLLSLALFLFWCVCTFKLNSFYSLGFNRTRLTLSDASSLLFQSIYRHSRARRRGVSMQRRIQHNRTIAAVSCLRGSRRHPRCIWL